MHIFQRFLFLRETLGKCRNAVKLARALYNFTRTLVFRE